MYSDRKVFSVILKSNKWSTSQVLASGCCILLSASNLISVTYFTEGEWMGWFFLQKKKCNSNKFKHGINEVLQKNKQGFHSILYRGIALVVLLFIFIYFLFCLVSPMARKAPVLYDLCWYSWWCHITWVHILGDIFVKLVYILFSYLYYDTWYL